MTFVPFGDDQQSLGVDDLTFENNVDRLAIYGSINIERDQAGLKKALALQQMINQLVTTLQAQADLPEKIEIIAAKQVKNPFL
jgi:hypothetical protein